MARTRSLRIGPNKITKKVYQQQPSGLKWWP